MLRIGFSAMLALATGLALAPPARAASEDAKERAARRACLAGNYKKGVEILSDLFVKTEDPVFIFNQGRCFEQNGRYEEAITRFREYLRKAKKGSAQDKADTEKHIADCQVLLGQKAAAPEATAATVAPKPAPEPAREVPKAAVVVPPPSAPPAANTSSAPPAVPVAAAQNATAAAPPPAGDRLAVASTVAPDSTAVRSGSGLRIAGISALAVGVAGIATGLVFNLKANNLASDIESERPYQRSREGTRASYETWSQVGYGVGGACLVGGAVLYYFGYAQGRDSQVALVPSMQAQSFGAAFQGVF